MDGKDGKFKCKILRVNKYKQYIWASTYFIIKQLF